jgi:AcrR family transcriptional regulator
MKSLAPSDAPVGPARRGRPPKRHPAGTDIREALVAAAADEFRETGYFKTQSNRIAQRAGLSPGVFYNYFSDKVEVLLAVYERWVDAEWALIGQVLVQGQAPSPAQIRRLLPAILQHHQHWFRLRHALLSLTRDEPRVEAARTASRNRQVDGAVRLLGYRSSRKLRTQVAFTLLAVEAVADCIASGEAARMHLDEAQLAHQLADSLISILTPLNPG